MRARVGGGDAGPVLETVGDGGLAGGEFLDGDAGHGGGIAVAGEAVLGEEGWGFGGGLGGMGRVLLGRGGSSRAGAVDSTARGEEG